MSSLPDVTASRPRATRSEAGGLKIRLAIGVLALIVVAMTSVLVATRHTSSGDDQAAPGAGSSATESGLSLSEPAPPDPVLDAAAGAGPTAEQVRLALSGLVDSRQLGPHIAVEVSTLDRDKPLYATDEPVVIPASTMKLLTCLTALRTVGPEHRFETTVVDGRSPREVVLVGGGDPLLTDVAPRPGDAQPYPAEATLADLATQTAAQLRADGRRGVSVGYDDSLFAGPAVNPTWEPSYLAESIVSPITSLWVDEGRATNGLARRVPDPSAEATARFSALLKKRGIDVAGSPRRVSASAGSDELASVSSAPLDQIVQHILELSDNEGAEVLLRQAAIGAGRAGSFVAGVATVRQTLGDLGVDLAGARLYDGSGLSRDDRVAVSTLVDVLQVASSSDHPELRAVVSTLPVAGFSGSLDYRLVVDAPDGLGVVRAKTGTLTGVHGLAGLVVTRSGTPLVFAEVADRVPLPKTLAARAQLDRIAAALASLR
jgi:D-alanyl-D-alanine carboxypeptidase/D-alanyl-D-alanine-endopeptidase (penicillin-binding protein 4)